MSELRTPVKTALRRTTTEASVKRMWHRIEARGRQHRSASSRPRVGWVAAALVSVGVALVMVATDRWQRPLATTVASLPHPAPPVVPSLVVSATVPAFLGPVFQVNGTPLGALRAVGEDRRVVLSDRTSITLAHGASLKPLRNSSDSVALEQEVGRVTYDITPGGPRRWTIECGTVTVEVIGTSFEIDRAEARVRVAVARGVVIVRSEALAGGVSRLTAGMSVEVPAALGPSATTARPPALPVATPIDSRPSDDWRHDAAEGNDDKAYRELSSTGIARESRSASVDDLFAMADVARLSGHPADAVEPLQRIIVEDASDARASVAALTLGRIRLTSLKDAAAAVPPLEKAVALGVPTGLAEDAYALLVEALSKAGEQDRARAALARFKVLFPNSARSAGLAMGIRGL